MTPHTSSETFVDLQHDVSDFQIWATNFPLLSRGQGLQIDGLPDIPEEVEGALKISIVVSWLSIIIQSGGWISSRSSIQKIIVRQWPEVGRI
jgi:hypothetical protein